MSKESGFTPMPEAQTHRLLTKATLPFTMHEHIGLNVPWLQSLCQLSGFRKLTVENEENPKISKVASMVVGIESTGEALSGGGAVEKVPTHSQESKWINYNPNRFKQSRWSDLQIFLNTQEMQQKIRLGNESVRDASVWARELNQALTAGIVSAGIKNLLEYPALGEVIMAGIWYLGDLAVLLNKPSSLLPIFLTEAFFVNAVGLLIDNPENFKEGSGKRWSLFVGYELDRALALLFMARTQKIAKEI